MFTRDNLLVSLFVASSIFGSVFLGYENYKAYHEGFDDGYEKGLRDFEELRKENLRMIDSPKIQERIDLEYILGIRIC